MVEMRLSTQAITNAVAKRLSILALRLLCLKVEERRKIRLQEQIRKIILKEIILKSPFTLFPIPCFLKVMYNHKELKKF